MLDWEERGLRTAAPDMHGTFPPILFNSHYWALITSSILGRWIPNGPHFVSRVENFLTIPRMNKSTNSIWENMFNSISSLARSLINFFAHLRSTVHVPSYALSLSLVFIAYATPVSTVNIDCAETQAQINPNRVFLVHLSLIVCYDYGINPCNAKLEYVSS